jgi:hypothetical protein
MKADELYTWHARRGSRLESIRSLEPVTAVALIRIGADLIFEVSYWPCALGISIPMKRPR